ncbi:MAG: dehydrogenase [Belnapia sp.]|nr:dehydrogenase [Belnapia sp.]
MLTGLLLGIGLLALLALVAAGSGWVPGQERRAARAVHGGCLVIGLGFAGVAAAKLGMGLPEVPMALPFGPPWGAAVVALDGLSAWFLLLLGLSGASASLFALGMPPETGRVLVPFPLMLAGMALTLIAADGFTLLLGFEVMSFASWALIAADHAEAENRAAARRYLMFAVLAGACLVPAFGLLAGPAGSLEFSALRASPPEGWRAGAVLALGLAGAGAKAGLVPLHAWLPPAYRAASGPVSALMSGVMYKVALYVLARLLLDLCGPVQPAWWGVPLVVAGAVSALFGALRANMEAEIQPLLACSTIENIGFITLGFGLTLAFRGADLGPLAALAAGASLLHALNHGIFKTLLFLVAGAVRNAAGSQRIDRLGGLIHAMPVTALAALVGIGAAASLPPLAGFASEWLLLEALLAGWRVSDIVFQVVVAAATALVAMAAALAAAAMVRFFGLVFLGRPRSPRGAGAREAPLKERWALLLPAGLVVLLGLFPGLLLALAAPAIRVLAGPATPTPATPTPAPAGLVLVAGEGASTYLPLAVALLLALVLVTLWFLVRRRSTGATQRGPVWNGGFSDPPPFLHFGDPLTQPGAAGFAQPLRQMLGSALLGAREVVMMRPPGDPRPGHFAAHAADPTPGWLLMPLARLRDGIAARAERLRDLTIRGCLSLSFGTLVVLLALLAWLEAR